MKKTLSIILSIVMLFSIIAGLDFNVYALSSSGSCGNNASYTFNSSTGQLVISGSGSMKDNSFSYDNSIKSVTISNGITSLGYASFYSCSNLTSVKMPKTLRYIDTAAFYHCSSLNNVSMSEGTTSIGDQAFNCCTSLTSIKIPNSVTSIGDYTFYNCSSLKSITIPNGVKSIGESAFQDCNNLSVVEIGNSVTSIGKFAFTRCSSLSSVTIPNSVTSLGENAFYSCINLSNVILGEKITEIKAHMFQDCSNLTSITIPKSVTRIEYYAFYGCYNLNDVFFTGTKTQWNSVNIEGANNNCLTDATIHFYSKPVVENRVEATCTREGFYYEVIYCSECKREIKRVRISIPIEPHNYTVTMDEKEPTCTEPGNTFQKTCKVCKKVIGGTIIPAKGHSSSTAIKENIKEATCTEEGSYDLVVYCSRCSTELSRTPSTVDKLKHKYNSKETKPTCKEQGFTTYTCEICNYTYNTLFTEALNHSFTNYVSNNDGYESTCTSTGMTDSKTAKCDRCDEIDTIDQVEIARKEHTPSTPIEENVIEATCTTAGSYDSVVYCTVCKHELNRTKKTVAKLGHKYVTTTTKATQTADGKIAKKCSKCNHVASTTIIPKASSITISTTKYTYDGNYKKPTVTVKDSKGNKLSTANYSVTYSNNKYVGKASVKVTLKGNYSGTKTLYYTINPKGTTLSTLTATSKGFKVTWKKQATQTTGYQIKYATNSKFDNAKTVTVTSNSTTSKSISKLTPKKRYYVRVRTYKTVNGTKYYSAWSGYKYVTTKA